MINVKKIVPLLVATTLLLNGCTISGRQSFNAEIATQALETALADSVTDENGETYRNAVIYVEAPNQNFVYTGAAGTARADTGEPMTVEHQFEIASIGKTMTAVIIMQLWEEGALGPNGLDATLEELQAFPPEVLDVLHIIDGVSYGREITVRHLLNQTTGLRDLLNDNAKELGDDYPEYMGYAPGSLNHTVIFDEERGFEAMMRCVHEGQPEGCALEDYHLAYTWPHWDYQAWQNDPTDKMAGLLNFFLDGANENALWQPGEGFHYSDTNYVILGLLIEELTGNSLHYELRDRIFDPLGMDATYMSYATNPPASQWENRVADHWAAGYPLISSGVNLSMDWSGGGEFSTVSDLNTFIRALANNELFENEATLEEMVTRPEAHDEPYAAGIVVLPADDGLLLHHSGSSGCWVEYHTAHDLSVAGMVGEMDDVERFIQLRADIYEALDSAGMQSSAIRTTVAGAPLSIALMTGQAPAAALIALTVSLLLFLSALIAWPIGALINRKRTAPREKTSGARWIAAATICWNLIFLVLFLLNAMSNTYQLMYGFTPALCAVLWLPWVSVVLTPGMLVLAALAWKNSYWHVVARVHYTLVALAAVGFLWSLIQFRLLGML
jgi:D-alanyl-D-alanine carboxypeptidase